MPLLEKLRRPTTSASGSNSHHHHRRHSSLITADTKSSTSSFIRGHRPIGSLQRLSLALPSNSNDAGLGDFLRKEADGGQGTDEAIVDTPPTETKTEPRAYFEMPPPSRAANEQDGDAESSTVRAQQRFSRLKTFHASDPQLSSTYKDSAVVEEPEEISTPRIITTSPTNMLLEEEPVRRKPRNLFDISMNPFRKSQIIQVHDPSPNPKSSSFDGVASTPNLREHKIHFEDHAVRDGNHLLAGPPAYGDESSSSLAIPISRLSESGGSEGSSGSHKLYARTTTTHTISTTTTFFRLKRKKKDKGPLFPLPERLPRPSSASASGIVTSEGTPRRSMSPTRRSTQAVRFETVDGDDLTLIPSPSLSMTAITNAPLGSPGPAIVRKHSTLSTHSGASTPSLALVPPRLGARGRSSTIGSLGRSSNRGDLTPQGPASGRTSTSTNGRRSFGDLLTFSTRLRQNSVPPRMGSAHSPGTPGSKPGSMQIPRDTEPEMVYPSRDPADTPASYLEKLEAAVPRGSMATILCKSDDEFARTCLRKYMRGFSYFQESIDMSIRKMLMEVELPKETQQIDRLLAGFADRYHECNPGIFMNADEASIIAFSILLLHSDNHNKNNKHKMQRPDYVKNTQHGQISIAPDILDCFYDNICYTPFIHFEDDVAVHSHRLLAPKPKKSLIKSKSSENLRGPVDPYTLILDNKLDVLRPPLKEVMDTEDTYSSTGTLKSANSNDHHHAFMHSAVLQIVSARSRPDAFMHQATISNPLEAQAGLVSIKIAKVGLLWRKDMRKKKAKRPWQEWGAILTDSKLYFFKDIGWTKKLMGQYDSHIKQPGKRGPLIFNPPLTVFEPDALMAMDDAIALMDTSYKKHKNAFTFIKHGGFEEVFLANTESDMNDWIGKLNYAATFRTAGIRMRGLLGTNYEGRHLLRKDSEISSINDVHTEQIQSLKKMDPQTAWEIMFYRHQLIKEKISGFDDKTSQIRAELDHLLRNARHLLLLLPIQQKSRGAIVLAAGRMSAKLKWTRVELWRTQTHVDILKRDLEAENVSAFPPPQRTSLAGTPQRPISLLADHSVTGENIEAVQTASEATSPAARRPSQTILEHITIPGSMPEPNGRSSPAGSPITLQDDSISRRERPSSPSLQHQTSIVSSLRSRQEQDGKKTDNEDSEDRALPEAGLSDVEGEGKDPKRRGSESEKEPIGSTSPGVDGIKERATSVRRSLQRTLRDTSLGHHTPSHHRKKGKESGSSVGPVEDAKVLVNAEHEELKRGTGSFILHGKKASVITMSPEWQAMSKDDRIKSRQVSYNESRTIEEQDSPVLMPTLQLSSGGLLGPPEVSSPVREDFVSATSSKRHSMVSISDGTSTRGEVKQDAN